MRKIAPEVLCRQNHGFVVDYYALGVIVYELMMKKIPFRKGSREEMREDVLGKPFIIKKWEIPEDWSHEAVDFITKVIVGTTVVLESTAGESTGSERGRGSEGTCLVQGLPVERARRNEACRALRSKQDKGQLQLAQRGWGRRVEHVGRVRKPRKYEERERSEGKVHE